MKIYHFTMRTRWGTQPFLQREQCHWAWTRLRAIFPDAYAVILMPNHWHVIAMVTNLARATEQVAKTFSHMPQARWEEMPLPEPIPDDHHLLRQIRYVLLNPCRKGLAKDPLEWEWSSYRDLLGLVERPWKLLAAVHADLQLRQTQSVAAFHAYVSGDPSVSVAGTPPPRRQATLESVWITRPEAVIQVAAQYLRAPSLELRKAHALTGVAARFLVDELRQSGTRVAPLMKLPGSTFYYRYQQAPRLTRATQQALVNLLAEPRFLRLATPSPPLEPHSKK